MSREAVESSRMRAAPRCLRADIAGMRETQKETVAMGDDPSRVRERREGKRGRSRGKQGVRQEDATIDAV